ncbi:MAG: hypothetical protein DME10_09260 [Candidatus Rokuibacteriota bacterium]|nr:MAG: hypothetical protein DME10_09260 [Candidatus Rokubacteria bacterium]
MPSRLRQRAHREGRQAESPALDAAPQGALCAPRHPGDPGAPRRARPPLAPGRARPVRPGQPRPRAQRREAPRRAGVAGSGRAAADPPQQARRPARRVGGRVHVPAQRGHDVLLARADHVFTLHSGAALVAPNVRFPAIHCYLEGDPEPVAKALGLRPGDDEGNVHLLAPYDPGVFHAPITKSGVPVVCLPQLYADLYHYERRGREQAAHIRREAMGF